MEGNAMFHIAKAESLIAGVVSIAMLMSPAIGAETTAVPNFSPDSRTGWVEGVPDGENPVGQDFLQLPSGPGPVTYHKAHPYRDNAAARRERAQAILQVANVN